MCPSVFPRSLLLLVQYMLLCFYSEETLLLSCEPFHINIVQNRFYKQWNLFQLLKCCQLFTSPHSSLERRHYSSVFLDIEDKAEGLTPQSQKPKYLCEDTLLYILKGIKIIAFQFISLFRQWGVRSPCMPRYFWYFCFDWQSLI